MKSPSKDYIKGMARNIDEKTALLSDFFARNEGATRRILEIGVGGGETLRSIQRICPGGTDLYAIDTEERFVEIGKSIIGEKAVRANACRMPFDDNFFDGINASSLFHEVSTYGYESCARKVVGLKAVQRSLREAKRVLREGGALFYRDVLAPQRRSFKKVIYSNKSILFFIDLFLEKFAVTKPLFYKRKYRILRKKDSYQIYGENFLHREIQKHFLLCLDNISAFLLTSGRRARRLPKKQNKFVFLERIFSDLVVARNSALKSKVLEWLAREGGEKYLYYTINELLDFCKRDVDSAGYVLLAQRDNESMTTLRASQNLFLKKIIKNPEIEGKQIIVFVKMKAGRRS